MTKYRLVIKQLQKYLYHWIIFDGGEIHAEDGGESSITDCLIGAVGALPETVSSISITYGLVDLGPMMVAEIADSPGDAADEIIERLKSTAA